MPKTHFAASSAFDSLRNDHAYAYRNAHRAYMHVKVETDRILLIEPTIRLMQ